MTPGFWFTACLTPLLLLLSCGGPEGTPAGAVVGRANKYDYTPSVIQTGNVQQFWWCGQATNPATSYNGDTILYESIDLVTGAKVGPQLALAETPNTWDGIYTCNPKVIKGSFANPLGDSQTYTYALYYVGTDSVAGTGNAIGVAFSNDGISWKKYPAPVIPTTSHTSYGVAQPVAYNADGKQAITLFYEDDAPPYPADHHWESVSTDGVHFTLVGLLTTNGLGIVSTHPSWADMVFNPKDNDWYAIYNIASRNLPTTEGILEYGQWGFQLYRIPKADLLIGDVGWQELKTVDTNLTNYESNFLPAILQDGYGNLYQDSGGKIQIFPSFSNAPVAWSAAPGVAAHAADLPSWDIGQISWSPTESPTYTLNRYWNGSSHIVTTGYIDSGQFTLQKTLGHVYSRPMNGATVGLFSCKTGSTNQFVSVDSSCGNYYVIGLNGYLYGTPPAGVSTVTIYSCSTADDHFVSTDAACEGSHTDTRLGYILAD